MTEPENPNTPLGGREGIDTDPVPSGPRSRFVSSPPPALPGEQTVLSLLRMFVGCDHPEEGQSLGIVIDADGSKKRFRWCGACGAVRLPADHDDDGDWLRTGIAQLLHEDERLAVALRGVRARVDKLAALTKTAHAASAASSEPRDSHRGELLVRLQAIESVCDELARFMRSEFGDDAP